MPAVRGENLELQASRYLPQVALATLAVVGLPLAVVTGIQFEGGLRSPWLSMLVAVVLSVAASSAGSAIWMRRPGSRDLVFGDLMLWGYIRRLRADRRIASTAHLLGNTPRVEPASTLTSGWRACTCSAPPWSEDRASGRGVAGREDRAAAAGPALASQALEHVAA